MEIKSKSNYKKNKIKRTKTYILTIIIISAQG